MRLFPFVTVDVFTSERFGGNPLAVVTDADGLSTDEMQSLAAEFNYSETAFVLPAQDPRHTAKVRIFNRTYEMPFAGHPNVGTAYVLATKRSHPAATMVFEEGAGLVPVRIDRDASGAVIGATITAPQALSVGPELPVEEIAACVGLSEADILVSAHAPRVASVGVTFVLVETVGTSLSRAAPSQSAFRSTLERHPELQGRLSIHLYSRDGAKRIRARMFSPLAGTVEDPATGSANAALAGLLLSLGPEDEAALEVRQGVEMRRPSILHVTARRRAGEIRAEVRGQCVQVFEGHATA